jgi:hypothetical protein
VILALLVMVWFIEVDGNAGIHLSNDILLSGAHSIV